MTSISLTSNHRLLPDLPTLLSRAWALNPTLVVFFFASLATAVLSVLGLFIDPRLIMEKPAWAKTFKFSVSFLIYTPTLLWMVSLAQARRRLAYWVGSAIGAILLAELVMVVLQAVRGEAMHFNVSTPFNATLWSVMSASIMVFYLFFLVVVIVLWRQFMADPVMRWAVRLALVVTFLGFGQGFLMTAPNAAQAQALEAGQTVNLIGAHTVGAASITPDSGPGLPLLGWSTQHGDLRIGHFIGIHALQAIPLLGFFLTRRRAAWLNNGHRVALVWLGAGGYLGLVALVTWQALRGQSLIAPDALTLGVAAVVLGAVAVLASAVLWQARRKEAR
jgi:hypothetical protein